MKMRFATLLLTLALPACAPLTLYYKAGAPVATVQRDTTACQVQALRDAPVANQIRRTPPTYVPARRVCNSAGLCTTTGGYYLPGEVYTYDVNGPLRKRVENQCMADRGYSPASIPACPNGVKQAATPAATATLPRLTPKSCAIRNSDGSFQIVNQG
ncbi:MULTISPECIES: hypothetical protein [Roseobacteraceae]|jgi:hypothetical protein|uniref:Lipoprotein n=1 Tax=Pseudosulfitobacter pseudonitzschiae TaxID=1402135 RepID=A0A221K0E1_9RHOB|nr:MULTISPECIES: hypothetical protein [Roseobacteraceae]ASM72441.1 hypothetical protein SULPSESMR1_01628 [Pseudosulfitobacter pseudonitzschiae]